MHWIAGLYSPPPHLVTPPTHTHSPPLQPLGAKVEIEAVALQ